MILVFHVDCRYNKTPAAVIYTAAGVLYLNIMNRTITSIPAAISSAPPTI